MEPEKTTKPLLSNETYNLFKQLVQLIMPAVATLYFSLASVWGLPAADEVVATLAALATFGGVTLKLSNRSYVKSGQAFDGELNVLDVGEKRVFSLDLDGDPENLAGQDKVVFKVTKASQQ